MKGLPASMLMANLQDSLRILGPTYDHMGKLMKHLNRLFRYNVKLIRFISLFLMTIDIKSDRLSYANAGHYPALLFEKDTDSIQYLKPTGAALGLIKDAEYEVKNLLMKPGEIVLLYSDDLVEARNNNAEEYGEERLQKFLRINHGLPAQERIHRLCYDVESFATAITDDLTILTVKRI